MPEFSNMEPFERIKYLRKNVLKLTQEKFADELHIARSSISVIEIGKMAITDRNYIAIAEKWNINEVWLREGKEPIFKEVSMEEEIAAYMGDLLANDDEDREFQRRFIKALSKLDVKDWKVIEKIVNDMAKEKD